MGFKYRNPGQAGLVRKLSTKINKKAHTIKTRKLGPKTGFEINWKEIKERKRR